MRFKTNIALGVLIGVSTLGLVASSAFIMNSGKVVYRGNVDGYNVVYEENRFNLIGRLKNKMSAKKGDVTYIFEDWTKETSIDWKNETKPKFENDRLEKMVISGKEYSTRRSFDYIDTTTIEGRKTREVLIIGSELYNRLRTSIREELRNDFSEEADSFIETIKDN